jgi:hypothetical protein
MRIRALSKDKFDKTLMDMGVTPDNVEDFDDKYFISISHSTVFDEDDEMEGDWLPMFCESKRNVLVLLFDDVITDENINGTVAMQPSQAEETVKFLMNIKNTESADLLVHCAMGSSRSVAVAEFAAKLVGQRPDFIEARIDRKANALVIHRLVEAYTKIIEEKTT